MRCLGALAELSERSQFWRGKPIAQLEASPHSRLYATRYTTRLCSSECRDLRNRDDGYRCRRVQRRISKFARRGAQPEFFAVAFAHSGTVRTGAGVSQLV